MVMSSRSSPGGGSASGGNSGRTRVGRYELGRTLGEGTFAKVKFARNLETGENVAIKILDKEKVLKHKMIGQIISSIFLLTGLSEISTMKLIRHPNVIRMFEVMASKTKIYIVMEFVTGGELFDKIVSSLPLGRLKEDEARKYFQQLINAVDYCHSRGVYHRDLKPENLLLDASGVLKVSDFGLSALPQQVREDGLLHTTCGTPNYVAPEVINNKGYDGAKADLWSCGINKADFSCPPWFSSSVKKLIKRILDPNPSTRITIAEVLENEWFKKGYKPPIFEHEEVTLDDVNSIFNESAGLNLNSLFEKQMGLVKRETRFTSKCPANEIITKIEQAAAPMGFDVKKNNYKMKLHGEKSGRKGHLSITTEIFEVAPSLHMVELRKAGGDTLEFHKFYKNLSTGLKDIVWKTGEEVKDEANNGKHVSLRLDWGRSFDVFLRGLNLRYQFLFMLSVVRLVSLRRIRSNPLVYKVFGGICWVEGPASIVYIAVCSSSLNYFAYVKLDTISEHDATFVPPNSVLVPTLGLRLTVARLAPDVFYNTGISSLKEY
ncbi:hypothetical protein DH2020_042206 [Rehmannia glutinosa]|uniref:Protein kinase domain-containing protein n=1 Tax=Rehmannia glutinosa TaxID=99300 RepID=A0ABR0UPJ6_REHGL